MGKGDLKTRRGKIFRGTYGKTRPKKVNKSLDSQTIVEEKAKKKTK
jgi:30S ribosomal protein S31